MAGQQARRVAVVVIHGIGEQPPVSTMGCFAQGLIDHAGFSQPEAVLRRVADGVVPVLRFAAPFPTKEVTAETDVMEFAWQHLVRGHTSVLPTLTWLLGTTLAPLDFARHWRILAMAGPNSPSPWLVVLRQLLIAGTLLVPLLLLPVSLVYSVSGWFVIRTQRFLLTDVGFPLPAVLLFGFGLVLALLGLLQLVAVLRDGFNAAKLKQRMLRLHGQEWTGLHGQQIRTWRMPAILVGVVLLGAASAIGIAQVDISVFVVGVFTDPQGRSWLLLTTASAAVLLLVPLFLRWIRDYAGDIAYYVTADRKPIARRSRYDIRRNAAQFLNALLRDPAYERIVVVGHSLGTVIAFDALNELSRQVRLENALSAVQVGKLKGLLTFASPLDKVAYFFREHTADDAAVHAQMLSFLHPTKRLPSRRDDGPYRLKPYAVPFRNLRWVNLHSPQDLISDPLVFYRVDELCTVNYWSAGAHGRYWSDRKTYQLLLKLLGDVQF